MTVTARDAFGNVATGYAGKLRFTSTDAGRLPCLIATGRRRLFRLADLQNFLAKSKTV